MTVLVLTNRFLVRRGVGNKVVSDKVEGASVGNEVDRAALTVLMSAMRLTMQH